LGRPSKYSPEFKHDAVELVRTSELSMRKVAADLGMSQETLRGWVNQAKIDRGEGPPGALTTEERQELTRLRRENAQLRMEREVLKKAAAFFARETTR
jgi:transposase